MSDDQDFSNYPESISELRGHKEHNAAHWKPRDALIAALRDIDSGEHNPYALIVVQVQRNPENPELTSCHFYASTPDAPTAFGLLEYVKKFMTY